MISVVVPIYGVEAYLAACLESIAAQTAGDLEVVMVDDGSRDGSADIAAEYARRDARFRLIRQPNGGLSKARNTGIDAATGDLLAFVDGDDVLPPDAYERLLRALEESGSELASGNVLRLTDGETSQAEFLAATFARTRLGTHVTRNRPLLADRVAWNKLWRRSFWDAHRLRFPEGVLHEDIPVVLPAHFLARSVDVVAEPVYLWRVREDSITQRRTEQRALLDRLSAVTHVRAFIARHGTRATARWYDERLVRDDLRLYLNVLDVADEHYRRLFLDRVNPLLDAIDEEVYHGLPAIDRLKWHLVRRRLMPEVLEVLRFQREELEASRPVRSWGQWYGDYPFRTDRSLRVPRSIYRLDEDLKLRVELDALAVDGATLRLGGHAHVAGIGAPSADAQRLTLSVLPPGRLRSVRLRTSAVRLRSFPTRRPDLPRSLAWSGFKAALDVSALADGRWDLFAAVRAGGVRRRWSRFAVTAPRRTALAGDAAVSVAVDAAGRVAIHVRREWMVVRSARVLGGPVLELTGEWHGRAVPVELVGEAHPVTLDGQAFTVRLPWRPGRLRAAVPLVIEAEGAWLRDGRELVLDRGGELVERPARDYPRRIAREVPSTSPPAPSASTAT